VGDRLLEELHPSRQLEELRPSRQIDERLIAIPEAENMALKRRVAELEYQVEQQQRSPTARYPVGYHLGYQTPLRVHGYGE
jgi:hypothetical protein